jgi:hypothetical protein
LELLGQILSNVPPRFAYYPGARDRYEQLTAKDKQVVRQRIAELQQRINDYPKTTRWKLRARIGERVKWYKDVEELAHR